MGRCVLIASSILPMASLLPTLVGGCQAVCSHLGFPVTLSARCCPRLLGFKTCETAACPCVSTWCRDMAVADCRAFVCAVSPTGWADCLRGDCPDASLVAAGRARCAGGRVADYRPNPRPTRRQFVWARRAYNQLGRVFGAGRSRGVCR